MNGRQGLASNHSISPSPAIVKSQINNIVIGPPPFHGSFDRTVKSSTPTSILHLRYSACICLLRVSFLSSALVSKPRTLRSHSIRPGQIHRTSKRLDIANPDITPSQQASIESSQ